MIPTTEKLAEVLANAAAPESMVLAARAGRYDDFKSASATPIFDLVRDLQALGMNDLMQRAMNGEFDGTAEECQAWCEQHRWRDVS